MGEQPIAIIITSILSTISLVISLKNYLMNKPKLKIVISDKQRDAYFGTVFVRDEIVAPTKIGFVELNIINSSPVDIFIKDIKLKIDKNYCRYVDKNNSYWKNAYFFYLDKNGEKIWDGGGIDYQKMGIDMPTRVKAYTILSGICLFHDFPNIDFKAKTCKVVLYTAVGKITKKVKFIKYDENYLLTEMKDIELFKKNLI